MASERESVNEPAERGGLSIRIVSSIGAFTKAEWDQLSGASSENCETPYNPFVSFDFLGILEESGCAVRKTGWQGHHLRLEDAQGMLLGAVPCYAKSHSQGEYVFDHAWADAWHRAGGSYYPKLQIAAPFTPATGPRLLLEDDAYAAPLLNAAERLCEQHGLSSAHATFIEPSQRHLFERAGWLLRNDIQFHWENRGYASFEDFLAQLSSRKRKDLRKERARAQKGVEIRHLTGGDLRPEHWDAFWQFYQDTCARRLRPVFGPDGRPRAADPGL